VLWVPVALGLQPPFDARVYQSDTMSRARLKRRRCFARGGRG
jgi:hypothetical protein